MQSPSKLRGVPLREGKQKKYKGKKNTVCTLATPPSPMLTHTPITDVDSHSSISTSSPPPPIAGAFGGGLLGGGGAAASPRPHDSGSSHHPLASLSPSGTRSPGQSASCDLTTTCEQVWSFLPAPRQGTYGSSFGAPPSHKADWIVAEHWASMLPQPQ